MGDPHQCPHKTYLSNLRSSTLRANHRHGQRVVFIIIKISLEGTQHTRVLWLDTNTGVYVCAVTELTWRTHERVSIIPIRGARAEPPVEAHTRDLHPWDESKLGQPGSPALAATSPATTLSRVSHANKALESKYDCEAAFPTHARSAACLLSLPCSRDNRRFTLRFASRASRLLTRS